MKRIAIAIALVCVFVGTSFAGDIPGVPLPPPPAASSAETEGDMGSVLVEEITDEIVLVIFGVFAG